MQTRRRGRSSFQAAEDCGSGNDGFNGVKLEKARFKGVGECHGPAAVIDNKQLVTHEARYVPLLSDMKVRKMRHLYTQKPG